MRSERKKPNLLVMVMKTHFVFFLIFFPLIRPTSAYGNLAKNPSMEGSFIPQGSLGDVGEDWTGWEELRGTYDLKGEFSEGDVAHDGSKSQKITWDNPSPSWPKGEASFGNDGIYQQIDSLQSGKIYRASFWFKGSMGGEFPIEGSAWFSLFGAIGADPEGGTNPSAVPHWNWTWVSESWQPYEAPDSPWYNLSVPFSPNGSTASIFIRMYGDASDYIYFYDIELGYIYTPLPWHLHCYIDDVVVESVEIGTSSNVEATSPVPANGVGYSKVTITFVDASGIPLEGVPASKITVHCTGNGNTIVGPDAATDANGQTMARITSTVAETKTVSVTVFGTVLSDTAVVEFTGGPFGPIWYVDADATGANDGSSWADAFNNLQDALTAASAGEEIRVAQGSYKPDQGIWVVPGRRQASFQLISGVTIKGGYAGFGESDPDARDVNLYKSILSGDLNGDDGQNFANNDENSYHVLVTGSGTDETAVLDGFTITAGNANGTSDPNDEHGGGLFNEINSSPTIINCTFFANSALKYGGGMTSDVNSSPTVTNCTFSNNSAEFSGGMHSDVNSRSIVINCTFTDNRARSDGGGFYNYVGRPYLFNCTFTNNRAERYGGGILNFKGDLSMVNCVISGNSAVAYGGGMFNWDDSNSTLTNCLFSGNAVQNFYGGGIFDWHNSGSLTVTNCTFSGNSAVDGNALACDSYQQQKPSDVKLASCILWDEDNEIRNDDNSTITVTYSDIQGGWSGEGNINTDPSFVNPGHWDDKGTQNDPTDDFWVDGDYNLLSSSLCIDAGDNTAVPPDANDIDGDGNKTEPIPVDLDGKPRFSDDPETDDTGNGTPPIVDMGAYEFQGISLITGDFCGEGSDQPDGYVDYWDLLYFAQRWHSSPSDTTNWDPRCDLDKEDNYVDYWDLLVFAQQWHKGQKP